MTVIPDSIEPVVGWRGFNFQGDRLVSSSYGHVWEPEKPAEARCLLQTSPTYRWNAVKWYDGDPLAQYQQPVLTFAASSSYFITLGSGAAVPVEPSRPKPPEVLLPPCYTWVLEAHYPDPHEAPAEGCNCGFHLSTDRATALQYGPILAECAGWGKTVKHAGGWRVEYAYPHKLYCADPATALKLERYGVEVELLTGPMAVVARSLTGSLERADRWLESVWEWWPLVLMGLAVSQVILGFALHSLPNIIAAISCMLVSCFMLWQRDRR